MSETAIRPRRWTEIRCTGSSSDYPREVHDEGSRIITAALAEVGFNPRSYWDEALSLYVHADPVPAWAQHMAAKIAADRLGITYEVVAEHDGRSGDGT